MLQFSACLPATNYWHQVPFQITIFIIFIINFCTMPFDSIVAQVFISSLPYGQVLLSLVRDFLFAMDLNSLNKSSAKVAEFPVSMAMGKLLEYSYTSKKDSSMVKTQKFDLRKSTPSCTTRVGCGYCSHQNEQVQ